MGDFTSAFASLTKKLGERILAEKDFGEVQVQYVDLTMEHERGYSSLTPAETSYPVVVHFINVHGQPATYTKTYYGYEALSDIVKELEEISYEVVRKFYND